MTVKTALGFTDRHNRFLSEQADQGSFAARSAVVASAVEHMIQVEEERGMALSALAEEAQTRMQTDRSEYLDPETALSAARAAVVAAHRT